jgi:hypothetical protein
VPALQQEPSLSLQQPKPTMRLLITGWVEGLPLLLKRLAPDYQSMEVVLLDCLDENKLKDTQAYIQRRLADESNTENISVLVQHWNGSDMEMLRKHVVHASHIMLARPLGSTQKPYTIISTILSHMISMIRQEGVQPKIFPILYDRAQARLLQDELDRFTLPTEVHLLVPDEFYGAYVAHTNFHMYTAETDDAYQIKRVLRHMIHDFMSEDGSDDALEIYTMSVDKDLANEPEALYASLLEQGYIWIGYRLKHAYIWQDPMQNIIRKFFPRESDFHCLRQYQIIINPFANPISRRSWEDHRSDIVELIVVGENMTPKTE